jgi:hypothetical protein
LQSLFKRSINLCVLPSQRNAKIWINNFFNWKKSYSNTKKNISPKSDIENCLLAILESRWVDGLIDGREDSASQNILAWHGNVWTGIHIFFNGEIHSSQKTKIFPLISFPQTIRIFLNIFAPIQIAAILSHWNFWGIEKFIVCQYIFQACY